jgi:uncharacterized protein (DUF305 family)
MNLVKLPFAFLALPVVLLLGACGSVSPLVTPENKTDNAPPMVEMGRASLESLEAKSGGTFDIAYMSQLVEHHMGAIDVAGKAHQHVERQEVKDAATMVIQSQADEIATLTEWLRDWYEMNPKANERALVIKDSALSIEYAKAAIERSDPDRAFLERIIPHHRRAIEMSQLALEKATRPELREFAQSVIDMQSAEIAQYQTWLEEWYGVTLP